MGDRTDGSVDRRDSPVWWWLFDSFAVESCHVFCESSGRVFDYLSVDSSRVCCFLSFEWVDGVVEFLHRERLPWCCSYLSSSSCSCLFVVDVKRSS